MPSNPNIKRAVSPVSLWKHPLHKLERKIREAAVNGFSGIEIVFTEITNEASLQSRTAVVTAQQIGEFARLLSIEILSPNAFKNFEANLQMSLSDRLLAASDWINIALSLGTRVIQVLSMFLRNSTGDEKIIISELQVLADSAAQCGLKIAYETVAFATHNALWQDSLRIANAVNRPNFRMCPD